MNFNNDILNKINWKEFLNFIMKEISGSISENNEVPQPASNPKLMSIYKGLFIKKDKFCEFCGEDQIFKGLQNAMNIGTEGVKIVDQFKTFKDSTGDGFLGSLYRYCDGSWYRGQRSNRQRDGKGKL